MQIRLPPLNPKATAPLKHLAAGMGSLFAGPVDDSTLLLQWSPSTTGSTLPIGGSAYRNEDHDSAAAAALGLGQFGSAGSKCRISCVLFGAVPGRLWAGCADGKVCCWALAGDGSVARLLHSWEAHSGKVKGIALSPSGRLFTGAHAAACVGTILLEHWDRADLLHSTCSNTRCQRILSDAATLSRAMLCYVVFASAAS